MKIVLFLVVSYVIRIFSSCVMMQEIACSFIIVCRADGEEKKIKDKLKTTTVEDVHKINKR